MSKGPVIIALAGGLVAGYLIGNLTSGGTADEDTAPDTEDHAAVIAQLEADARSSKTARREAESALRDAQRRETAALARAETAESTLAAAEAAAAAATGAADASTTGDGAPQGFPVYTPQGLEAKAMEVLAETEWTTVGGHMAAMSPALESLAATTASGEPMDPAAIQVVQENNTPLAMTAVRLMGGGVPGTGANGAFTHPGFMINAMAAALEAAELPLSEKQKQRFATLGDDFMGRYATQLAGYTDDTLTLRKMIDETELKQDLVTKLRLEMTSEQVNAISPESVRDHVGIDLFSAGIIWVGRLRTFRHDSRDDLVAKLQAELLQRVPESDRAPAQAEIQSWADGLPNEVLEHSSDALERRGWGTLDRTLVCAKHMIALIDRLFERGQLPDAVKANIGQSQGTLMFDRPSKE